MIFPRHIQHGGPRGPRLVGRLPVGELPHRDQRLPRLQRHLRPRLPRMRGLCIVHQCRIDARLVRFRNKAWFFHHCYDIFLKIDIVYQYLAPSVSCSWQVCPCPPTFL